MVAGDYGEYTPSLEGLPSLWENTESKSSNPGKTSGFGKSMVDLYTPPGSPQREDCVAWPLKAKEEDLKGLPPHVISVNELDALRDEGLEYYRKLRKAGVTARAIVSVGTDH